MFTPIWRFERILPLQGGQRVPRNGNVEHPIGEWYIEIYDDRQWNCQLVRTLKLPVVQGSFVKGE